MLLNTYRYHGHHVGDINRGYYRTKEEEEDWKARRDPIANFGDWLVRENIATADELDAMADAIKADAEEAVAYALEAPYPPASEVDAHVYAS
jgi:pyruvate dehydrogenase E1 component alpha subunit